MRMTVWGSAPASMSVLQAKRRMSCGMVAGMPAARAALRQRLRMLPNGCPSPFQNTKGIVRPVARSIARVACRRSLSVGSVLDATTDSDPDFAAVTSYLTNDTADVVCVGTCEEIPCGATCTEEARLFGLPTTDFSGATIEKVSLRVDSLSFGRDDRGGEVVRFQFTIKVRGVRPQPDRTRARDCEECRE